MKVLNLATNDYANFSHENANALRFVGVDCQDWKTNKHPHFIGKESKIVSYQEIQNNAHKFDVIQVFHSDPQLWNIVKRSGKKIIVYHTGTRYRQESDKFDKMFLDAYQIITDQCEFIHGSNMHYLAPHVMRCAGSQRCSGHKPIIGHFPSNPENKGTDQIRQMLQHFHNDFEIRIDTKLLNHEQNLKRIAECDIYVELFIPTQRGKPYGCHGTTAFEATALGCQVVTNNINLKAYTDVYGDSPFLIANTESKFFSIFELLKQKRIKLPDIFEKHSIKATGERILKLIG